MSPKSKKTLMVIIPIVLIGLVSIMSYQLSPFFKPKEVEYIMAQWGGYSNITEAANSVELIIVGEVSSIVKVGTGQIPSTRFEVKILEIIKKPFTFSSDSIIVEQLGAETETKIIEVKYNPLLKVGEKVILFLNPAINKEGFETVVYGFAGPWSRYRIVDNKVYSLDVLYTERFNGGTLDTRVDGLELGSFIDQIKGYIVGGS